MIYEVEISAAEIENNIDGRLTGENCLIRGISIDSRDKSFSPWCFFAIKGKKYNGADFIEEAISNGAKLVIAQEKISSNVPVIYVDDTVKALGMLARKEKGKTKIIGVTGSFGKTTVKDMIISVLSERYSVCGTKENQNNEIGVALTLLSIKSEAFCVVEMGMRAQGEIDWLSYLCEPDTAVITGIGTSHIGLLGGKEAIFSAKTEILKHTKKYAVVPFEREFFQLSYPEIDFCFIGKDITSLNKNLENNCICFDINGQNVYGVNSIFLHDVTNALFAYSVGKIYGLTDDEIRFGLLKSTKSKMRGEIINLNGIEILCDCYNASLESIRSALVSANEYCKSKQKRLVAMLGDVLELGDDACKIHMDIGVACRENSVKKLFAYGENAKYVCQGFGGGEVIKSFADIPKILLKALNNGDLLLVKASRGLNFEKIIEKMRENSKC
jgi:UDP-N-acetylmuramoyl-tripeptide--D-alanyl-D-alanine ligase